MKNTSNLLKNFFSIADEAFYKHNQTSSFFFETTPFEDRIEVEMILPGYDRDELTISSDEENLLIETNQNFKESKWKSTFKRAFKISENLDSRKIKAKLENGIMTISIPKKEKPKRFKVSIS